MSKENEILAKANRLMSLQRRELAKQSPELFAKIYLPKYFNLPASRMHRELFDLLHPAHFQAGAKLATAAPRGHAKSTLLSLAYILYCICNRLERYIILLSSTMEQATTLLRHVKDELISNPLLLSDFPEACEPPGTRPGPPRWTQREIITRNDVKITAASAPSRIRGRRHKDHRPGLVICDDLETDAGVVSELQRQGLANWFYKVVLNCGTSATKFVVVGTLLHYDSLLSELIDEKKSPAWTKRKYQAVESWAVRQDLWEKWALIYNHHEESEGASGAEAARRFFEQNKQLMLEATKVLWPEREDYYALMELRLSGGQASFDSEKQNDPIDPATCLFPEHSMHFWDDQWKTEDQLLASLDGHVTFFGACDPSMGKAGRHRDDSAIITIARDDNTGKLYVLDADIRRRSPDETICDIIEYERRRGYEEFGMETIQFQEFLAQELIKRSRQQGCEVPVTEIKPVTDKLGRIQSLQPKVHNGAILFSRGHRTLLQQLRQFPKAAHDDGPDALHMAVYLATTPRERPGILILKKNPVFPGSNTFFLTHDDGEDDDDDLNEFQRRFREFLRE